MTWTERLASIRMDVSPLRSSRDFRLLFSAGWVFYFGSMEVWEEFEMNARTEAIDLPIYIFTGAMPVVSIFILIRIFFRLKEDLRNENY